LNKIKFLNFLSTGLDPLSPVGIIFLSISLLFTATCIYILSSLDQDSINDKKRKNLLKRERDEKIARLYPKKS
tara:strand:- start:161 stop:379 length:219 start_codon:yes stop_codon:yes gene_type:complete